MLQQIDFSLSPIIHEWPRSSHVCGFVARKEWIEREKEREKVEFPFKKGRGEGNKGEMGKRKEKINLLELNFFP